MSVENSHIAANMTEPLILLTTLRQDQQDIHVQVVSNGLPCTTEQRDKDKAATQISVAYLNHMSLKAGALPTKLLRERLTLEVKMRRGLRLLFACALMFVVVMYSASIDRASTVRMETLSSFKSLFDTGSMPDISTREDFAVLITMRLF